MEHFLMRDYGSDAGGDIFAGVKVAVEAGKIA
jgi:hypothetical protein